jgi:hypothetical protein
MKLANGILMITLAAVLSGLPAQAQTPAPGAKPETEVRTFYLNNVIQGDQAGNEILNAIRNGLDDSHVSVYLDNYDEAIVVRATPDQLTLAQKIINDLDKPKKTYRLTYTVTEMDGTRRIGAQHFAMVLIPGQRTTLNESSKVPIATGTSYPGVQTQFTYIDVGMTFDATVTELGKGVRLQSKVTQASAAAPEESSPEGKVSVAGQPVRRETSLEGASFLTLGKPMVLGSMDLPGSTRHLEVEALMEEAVR